MHAMSFRKYISLFLLMLLAASTTIQAQDKTTGGIKGKVRVTSGSASGVNVTARQGEREIASATTDAKGAFSIMGLAPGTYNLVFRKTGLSTGALSNVEVRAGKMRDLSDKLVLTIDEGSIAFLRGSVFDSSGRSVPGAKIELARVGADGTVKKLDGRLTNESGQFVFRLTAEATTYRVTAKMDGAQPVSKDVLIDGAAVYRIALSLKPATK
jgi:hypothetical protein